MDSNLLNAAVRGDIEPFKETRQRLTQIVNESKDTILHVHIKRTFFPSTEFVERILGICPELLLQVNDQGNTPLHLAAATWGKHYVVDLLLKCARVQTQDLMLKMKNRDGKTTFDIAMEYETIEVVKLLIKERDPNSLDFPNNIGKLLNLAAETGDHEILEEIQKIDEGRAALLQQLKYDKPGTRSKDTILHVHIKITSERKFRPLMKSTDFVKKILDIYPPLRLKVNDEGNTPLHVAAVCNEYATAQVLLEHVRDDQSQDPERRERAIRKMLNTKNKKEKTAFDLAMDKGNIEVVDILIKKAKSDVFDHFANSVSKILDLAAKRGYYKILDSISNHEKGKDALCQELRKCDEAGTPQKDTILHIHIKTSFSFEKNESTEFVKKILDIYPPLRLKVNAKGNTPLHVAAECNKSATVQALLEHVGDDQSQDPERRQRAITKMLDEKNKKEKTAFDLAMEKGNVEAVDILIKEAESDVFDFANSISKILDLAARRGYHEILDSISIHEKGKEALFQELSDCDDPETPAKDTILHIHIKNISERKFPKFNRHAFVKKILGIYPPLRLKDNAEGNTPLHVAAEYNDYATAAVLLEDVGDDKAIIEMLNTRNIDQKTAFDLAVEKGNIEVVNTLIKKAKGDVFDFANSISKILYLAAESGYYEVLDSISIHEEGKTALDEELNKYDNPGAQPTDTILHINISSFRSSSDKFKFVEYVLGRYPLLLKQVNADKDSPLHVAARRGKADIVQVLLRRAKDQKMEMLKMRNSDGKTAFDVAVDYEKIMVLKILIHEAGPEFFSFIANIIGKILNLAVESRDHEILKAIADAVEGREALIKELSKHHIPGTVHSKETILHTHIKSVWRRSKDIVETLLELYPSLQLQVDDKGDTPIHVAVKRDEFDIVKVLLEHHMTHAPKPREQNGEERSNGSEISECLQYGMMKVLKCAKNRSKEKKPEWKEVWEMKNGDGKTILDIAVENDEVELVNLLIAVPELLDFDNNFRKILHFAARRGDYKMATSVAKSRQNETVLDGPVVDASIPEDKQSNDTILHGHIQYSKKPSTEFMTEILDNCPSLLVKVNKKGHTPLHVAAKCGHDAVVNFLLQRAKDKPQDLESGLKTYWEMLRMKSSGGNKASIQVLKMKNSEGNKADDWRQMLCITNDEGNTALHEAVRHGKFEVVEMLIKADPSVPYFANNAGETPLYLAAARGYHRIVHEILENCKSVSYEGPNGMTALHAAVMKFEISGSKSAASGNPNEMTNSNDSGSSGSMYNHSGFIMRKIYEKNKSLTKAQDAYGWTPLHYAAYHGYHDKVSLLLEFDKSATYIANNDREMTALHMAASQGHKDIIEKFISECLECCEMVDNRRRNLLHFAMISLSKEELIHLLRNPLVGSDLINKKDVNGNTPLHFRAAAYRDSLSLIRSHYAVNNQAISVQHILEHGSHELEKEIHKMSEDIGKGQYIEGVIRERKDEEYFKIRSERRKKYYDGLKETRSSHLLVAALIATVTFTAAFTIPGGFSNEKGSDQGSAILNKNSAFRIFIITDSLALAFSLSAVFVHFIMSFETFQKDRMLFNLAFGLTMVAMGAVVFAFAAGIYAVLAPTLWLKITTCSIGLSVFPLVFFTLILMWRRVLFNWVRAWKRQGLEDAGCDNLLPICFKKGN